MAWDLGDPAGEMITVGGIEFHPMKGLKTTQWLLDVTDKGTGFLHWRGDKETLHDFAGTMDHLQGGDAPMDAQSIEELNDFLANTYHGPNPYRNWRTSGSGTNAPYQLGRMNAANGAPYDRIRGPGTTFQPIQNAGVRLFSQMDINCTHCHQMQTGRSNHVQENNENIGADLRTSFRKLGFYYTANSTAGFGFMSDGAFDTWVNQSGIQHYLGDYQAELMAWTGGVDLNNSAPSAWNEPGLQHADNHSLPAVGLQKTINGGASPNGSGNNPNNVDWLRDLANDQSEEIALIVKGIWQGERRGFLHLGGNTYQPDLNGAPTVTHNQLKNHAAQGNPLTWTMVHSHVAERFGVDRDMDGIYDYLDGDVELDLSVFLEGPMIGPVMRTDLRQNSLLPTTDPYGFGAMAATGLMERVAASAPVDWVMVQLRDPGDPTAVVDEVPGMVQADGRVVRPDGATPLVFSDAPRGSYHVAVLHRNHLGAMTAAPVAFGTQTVRLDFSDAALATYGTDARKPMGGIRALWAGDVNGDGVIRYTGGANDRDPVLSTIGGATPTATVAGYLGADINLDGMVKYTGAENDRDKILVNVGGAVPTSIREEQVP